MMSFSIQRVFYTLASFFGIILLMYLGKPVLVPLAFALLIAFILYPICRFLERKGVGRLWAVLWSMIACTLLILGLILLFSSQIIVIVKEFGDFTNKLHEVLASFTSFMNQKVSILPDMSKEELISKSKEWFSSKSGGILSTTLSSTAVFISGAVLTIIYTFLLLLYRRGLKTAFVHFAAPDKRKTYAHMIDSVQKVGQQYLTGMFILILILGTLNTTGLLLLGIDYALFFGFLAGFLAIVPYVGTTTGGAIPAIYAFMTYESYWYPIGVILIFWFIQVLEGNFLSPKIVGGNLNLNALVAILALISGGLVWGIPGMILFLPYLSVLKVVSEHYEELKPITYVLRDDLYSKEDDTDDIKDKVKKLFK